VARFTKSQKAAGVSTSLDTGLPSASELTIEEIREAIASAINETERHLPSVSTAEGFIFQIGSIEDNWFNLELLEVGNGGIDNQGYQIVPMITGSGINQVNPVAGSSIPSNPFDGASEITAGTGATENMISTTYAGQMVLTGHILAEPQSGQANRQIEVDIAIYDSQGNFKQFLQIDTSTNSSPAGKANTNNLFTVTIEDPIAYVNGDCLALVIRKHAGEPNTTVTIQKCALNLTLIGLRQV